MLLRRNRIRRYGELSGEGPFILSDMSEEVRGRAGLWIGESRYNNVHDIRNFVFAFIGMHFRFSQGADATSAAGEGDD